MPPKHPTKPSNPKAKPPTSTPLSPCLSYTTLNPWKAPPPPEHRLRSHFKDFCSAENYARAERGEQEFCTLEARDAAFERLLKLARGEERSRWDRGEGAAVREQFMVLDEEDWPEDEEGEGDGEDEGMMLVVKKKGERKDSQDGERGRGEGWKIELRLGVKRHDGVVEYRENIDE